MMLMTLAEASEYLKIGLYATRALARAGKIPAGKIGSQWRIHKDDIDSYIRSQYQRTKPAEVKDDMQ
jgi:excisionase family DNA binding protein